MRARAVRLLAISKLARVGGPAVDVGVDPTGVLLQFHGWLDDHWARRTELDRADERVTGGARGCGSRSWCRRARVRVRVRVRGCARARGRDRDDRDRCDRFRSFVAGLFFGARAECQAPGEQ